MATRPLSRLTPSALGALLAAVVLLASPHVRAQEAALPSASRPSATMPNFALWGPSTADGKPRWEGSYASVYSGFSVTKFRHGPTVASPETGLSVGRNWQQGNVIWGLEAAGSFSPMTTRIGGPVQPFFSDYSRDLAGIARVKGGVLLSDNLLVYSSVGVVASHDRWRYTPAAGGFTQEETRVRPDIRAGAQWQPMPGLTLGFEVGVQPGSPGFGWR